MDGWSKDLGFRVAVIGAGLVVCVGGGGSLEERVVKEGYLWVGWDLMGARE